MGGGLQRVWDRIKEYLTSWKTENFGNGTIVTENISSAFYAYTDLGLTVLGTAKYQTTINFYNMSGEDLVVTVFSSNGDAKRFEVKPWEETHTYAYVQGYTAGEPVLIFWGKDNNQM